MASDALSKYRTQLNDLMERTAPIPNAKLLAEVEELIRTMPDLETLRQLTTEAAVWRGRFTSVARAWDMPEATVNLPQIWTSIFNQYGYKGGYQDLVAFAHGMKHDLMMKTDSPTGVIVPEGKPFQYLAAVVEIVQRAKTDILFVDPYMDTDFINCYLTTVGTGVSIRLLTKKKNLQSSFLPHIEVFVREHGNKVEVRTHNKLHDRYIFIDRKECYQTGASLKDGGKNASAMINQQVDLFADALKLFEDKWQNGTVERK